MATHIDFTGARLLKFQRTPKGGSAEFAANHTSKIARKLEWTDQIPEFLSGATPETDLSSQSMTSSSGSMDQSEYTLQISRCYKFRLVRLELENQRAKGHRLEVRFTVSFGDVTGCANLESWMALHGDSKGTLRVNYTKAAVQETLLSDEQTQATLEEADED